MTSYILDACAMIALLKNEPGAGYVEGILDGAERDLCEVYIHRVNLLEVYYEYARTHGEKTAKQYIAELKKSELKIIPSITERVFFLAGRLKTRGRISICDAILLGQSTVLGASVVTSDHHEFDALEGKEGISFSWIR